MFLIVETYLTREGKLRNLERKIPAIELHSIIRDFLYDEPSDGNSTECLAATVFLNNFSLRGRFASLKSPVNEKPRLLRNRSDPIR